MLNKKNINKKFGLILSILFLAVFVQGLDDCDKDNDGAVDYPLEINMKACCTAFQDKEERSSMAANCIQKEKDWCNDPLFDCPNNWENISVNCDPIWDNYDNTLDKDGDGFSTNDGDCNDKDANINPDAEDTDNKDMNCDGIAGYIKGCEISLATPDETTPCTCSGKLKDGEIVRIPGPTYMALPNTTKEEWKAFGAACCGNYNINIFNLAVCYNITDETKTCCLREGVTPCRNASDPAKDPKNECCDATQCIDFWTN